MHRVLALACALAKSCFQSYCLPVVRRLNVSARTWKDLSPVSSLKNDLSPVVLGTNFLNGDNDLRAFLQFVPSVPTFFGSLPDETRHKSPQNLPACCLLVLVRGCNQPFLDQHRLIGRV
jgi:hypothetical protein